FVVRFNRSLATHGVYLREAAEPGGTTATGPNVGAYASFDTAAGRVVAAKVGTSCISIEHARANLEAEIPAWDFEGVRTQLERIWNGKLGMLTIEGATDEQRRSFYTAFYKDAMTPPEGDMTRDWHDRQPGVPYEARPGLTYYKQLGYIPVDKTAESASETLEDAYDDYAVAQVARAVGRKAEYRFFVNRSHNYRNIYNSARGFMQAKHADGSWARPEEGWTE